MISRERLNVNVTEQTYAVVQINRQIRLFERQIRVECKRNH